MQKNILLLVMVFSILSCSKPKEKITQVSPDGKIEVEFFSVEGNKPAYKVLFNQKTVIDTSLLGFEFSGNLSFQKEIETLGTEKKSFSEKWEMPWGEKRIVDNTYNELTVKLKQNTSGLQCNLVFKIYNYGIGFRYEFPEQDGLKELVILDEKTQFNHICTIAFMPNDNRRMR